MRNVTYGNCKDLEHYVSNQRGKIPIFGYPLLTFSPPDSGRTITDKKIWRVATIGDGNVSFKDPPLDIKHISRTIENTRTQGTREISPRSMFRKKSKKAPAGIKVHLYQENGQEYEDNYVTKWKQIHGGVGM